MTFSITNLVPTTAKYEDQIKQREMASLYKLAKKYNMQLIDKQTAASRVIARSFRALRRRKQSSETPWQSHIRAEL